MPFFRTEKQFLAAAAEGNIDLLRDYLDKSPKYLEATEKKTGDNAIRLAARNGHVETLRFLLAKGATVTSYNPETYAYPLHEAVTKGQTEVVKVLLENGAASQITGGSHFQSPLQLAISYHRLDILKLFIESGKANLTADNPPAVYFAVNQRTHDALKMLLEAGASPNVPKVVTNEDYWGRTTTEKTSPLFRAAQLNDTEIGMTLLNAGAQPDGNETPIHAAAVHGNIELATELIKRGVSFKTRNEQNQTALHVAAQKNQVEMARFLLAQGIDRDQKDKQGNTALAYAQQFAMKDMIALLQNPLPPLVEIKPVEVKPVPAVITPPPKPVVVEEKPKPQPQPPKPAPVAVAVDTETWALAGKNSVIHTNTYPSLGRKLTEIFNFESRERVVITENMKLQTESMGPHVAFENLTEEYLRHALQEFRKLGGKADDTYVFRGQLNKTPLRQP